MKSGELRAPKRTSSFPGSAEWVSLSCILLGLWATATGGFAGLVPMSESRSGDQINVLLIGVDTLRADHVECYGSKDVRTPHMNRLAKDGVLFRNAVVQVPLTLPSFCSIMTGTYPMYHGVRDFSYGSLRQDKTTLAELLKGRGYATGAFIGAFVLDARFGLDQGFDHYDGRFNLKKYEGVDPGTIQRRGDGVASRAIEWIGQNRDQQFFAWIHLYDPHHPYTPPEPYRSRYANPYAGEIAYTDSLVGRILAFLDENDLYDNTLIVFTSDHGESLGEHQEQNHGFFIYDTTLKVPLVMKLPRTRARAQVVETQVRSIDILPTVLQYLRLDTPKHVQGVGLRGLIEGKPLRSAGLEAFSESYYPRSSFGWSPLRSLRTRKYKYILAPQPELYDLEEDPHELSNLASKQPSLTNRFKENLLRLEQRYGGASVKKKSGQLDPQVAESLRSLGYVALSEGVSQLAGGDESLPDPKDKVALFNLYLQAQDASQMGEGATAISLLEKLLDRDPNIQIALHTLTNRYLQRRDYQKALNRCQSILEKFPDSEAAAYNLGRAYSKLNRQDEAISSYLRAISLNGNRAASHHNLGIAYLNRKDSQAAIEELRRATELEPSLTDAYVNLGLAYFMSGAAPLAAEQLQKALQMEPEHARAHRYLGEIYVRTGRKQEGEAELQRAKDLKAAQER